MMLVHSTATATPDKTTEVMYPVDLYGWLPYTTILIYVSLPVSNKRATDYQALKSQRGVHYIRCNF